MKKSDINVLIIEDDTSVAKAMEETIKRAGFTAIVANKPSEAERVVKVKPVHAIVADCMLPGINGVDLVKKLKDRAVEDVPIILVTGIFLDKAYPAEAKNQTGAVGFLYKPLDMKQILVILEEKLAPLIDAPKVDLHLLLAQPYASNRERRKALDHVEDVCGYDLPLILSILLDAESSGHLNLVSTSGEIFGITLAKGKITNVDSEKTVPLLKELLEGKGFVTSKDFAELEVSNKKGNIVKNLIREGLMSPHATAMVKPEQMTCEIRDMITDKKLQVNFVPDRKLGDEPGSISLEDFTLQLQHHISKRIPSVWLKGFYKSWEDYPIKVGPNFKNTGVFDFPVVKNLKGLAEDIKEEKTLGELLSERDYDEDSLYQALHLLAIRRVIVFSESKREMDHSARIKRIELLLDALRGKSPFEVFQYFGASENPKVEEVENIYKEFVKSNHPDTLPQNVPEEDRKKNHELFTVVSEAHDILSNPTKKQQFLKERRQREAEDQMKAEEIVSKSADLLSRGEYSKALEMLEQAKKLYSSETTDLHIFWGKLKSKKYQRDSEFLNYVANRLQDMESTTKQTALYFFIRGLHKSVVEDFEGAFKDLQKCVGLDPRFMPARREMGLIKSQASGGSSKTLTASEILTGDLTQIVGNFFKKKKKNG